MAGVIFLSGPIGAGKTSVAGELSRAWTGPLACIEGDRFWPCFVRAKDTGPREMFTIVMRAMTAASLPFVRSGYDVILDFSTPPAFIDTARKILKDIPIDFVLLRPTAETCAARARCREDGRIESYDHGFYALFQGMDAHAVADDADDAAGIAARVRAGLAVGAFRVGAAGE